MAQPVEHAKEDLSRMEGTYGKKVIGKLKQMSVLMIGLKGLGVEIAKNLVLAGPRTVALHDDEAVAIADLGANFYLKASDVGTGRAQASLRELGELNPNVSVSLHEGELDAKYIAEFDVVVSTDQAGKAELIRRNKACREGNAKFIYAASNGVFVSVFTDFGDAHDIFDKDGVPTSSFVIDNVEINAGQATVLVLDQETSARHGLSNGDYVKIEEAETSSEGKGVQKEGEFHAFDSKPTSLNGVFEIKKHVVESKTDKGRVRKTETPYKMDIADCAGAGNWIHGGLATQIKLEKTYSYNALEAEFAKPTFDYGYQDYTKFGLITNQHFVRLALLTFQDAHDGALPKIHDRKDADECVELAVKIVADYKAANDGSLECYDLDGLKKLVKTTALYAGTELAALAALWGGVVAQEIVKFAGKYTPITQWLHSDIPELLAPSVPVDAIVMNTRYDHQIALFGKGFQNKLFNQKVFLVGCGALGCELLKAIAMMGLGVRGGEVHITDMDTIELSNLSRQFLFRRKHVNKPKSTSAGEVVVDMNGELGSSLFVHNSPVGNDTEDIFDDGYWNKLDLVINALDNIKARQYTDRKCVLHTLPLFESGTLGTQANASVHLPFRSPAYSEGAVPGEDSGIAQCTLQNFPSLPLHCIEYAKEKFDEIFVGGGQRVSDFLRDREDFLARNAKDPLTELDGLKAVQQWLDLVKNASIDTCVQLALKEFEIRFDHNIRDLIRQFPRDARTTDKETGADLGPFWRGHKRFPTLQCYSADNQEHVDFVYHSACIFSAIFNLEEPTVAAVTALASSVARSEYAASDKKIELKKEDGDEAAAAVAEPVEDEYKQIDDLKTVLRAVDLSSFAENCCTPADFEKDDDTNHHIDWITSCTNMRASNYGVKRSTSQHCRMIAGRIIPAIATTTAAITGYVQVEVLKYLLGRGNDDMRQATLNLATNTTVIECLPDPKLSRSDAKKGIVCIPNNFTVWDHVILEGAGNLSVEDFVAQLPKLYHGVQAESLWRGGQGGKAMMIFESRNPFKGGYKLAVRKLKKGVKDFNQKKRFQEQVDNYDAWVAEYADLSISIKDKFIAKNGPFVEGRNFVLLSGSFTDDDMNTVLIPTLKLTF